MKALVTGANGFTGSHLVRALEQRGDDVSGLVRSSSNLARLTDCRAKLVYGDITDKDVLRAAIAGVDTVFHTAAYVELGVVDEAEMERVNVQGTQAVLEVAYEVGVSKVVYCSTIGVFGDTKGQVVDETFKRTQTDFSSAYDRTKYQAQQLVDQFAERGLPVVSVLPSGIYGSDDPHFGPVMQQFLKGRLKLWAGGDRITGFVHVDDLAAAMILAAEKGVPKEHYIISAGELSTREMFEIIGQQANIPVPLEAPKPLVRLLGNLLDPIGRLLKWQPPLSRERVHYIYDRCVRVDATKARQQLAWRHRSVLETLHDIINVKQTGG
ncbi:NAD-dependent epimerase/dehydratase family protein [Aetokthonos hydrillicola Thurmond2011]|jgi:nucleoside-diphosphate-sugar epimerase|uniref:NAD-dependent epimerase/dehydratase family protein n=1 Tax=Aetokthonos hydrillicola Thurmond2011 TaxID=2712845 RepID=A0AAP5I795_9CYAN|nr:NAD-dependent epimerase/dehydratase family protein [Aetokthonos hydrillicola]MBO3460061.1 NAD-dependent epimerase/dehydratase family protein [Aetokthonos hydrillicola CCALA 1050]MBW4589540.1 NAD-dependent epimerase/dehydratase family protein [Aetokthonos hydrillicola CCALA 1050]MDR9896035.1 NAD-dependent epimerase/dehydratase family protein [Aetokthonos hydrillicola Thurmond2011]